MNPKPEMRGGAGGGLEREITRLRVDRVELIAALREIDETLTETLPVTAQVKATCKRALADADAREGKKEDFNG